MGHPWNKWDTHDFPGKDLAMQSTTVSSNLQTCHLLAGLIVPVFTFTTYLRSLRVLRFP